MIAPETLERVPWLAGLGAAARRELAARASLALLAPGEVLWTAGARPRGLFVVLEGRVRVVRGRGGRQRVLHTEGPGGTLGEVPLFAGGRYPATAVAAEATRCLVLGRDALEAAVAADPALAFALLGRMAGRVRALVERFDRDTGTGVRARAAAFLLERALAAGEGPFALGAPQGEVAEELGTVREVLVRALRHLRETGAVRARGGGRYEVADEALLRRIARGEGGA